MKITDKKFTEIVKRALGNKLYSYAKQGVWERIRYELDEAEVSSKEKKYWCNSGNGDAIVDKILEIMLDRLNKI